MKIYRVKKNPNDPLNKTEITPEEVAQGINKILPNDKINIYLTLTEAEDCADKYKHKDEKTGELVPNGIENRKFFLSEIGPNGEKRGIAYARTNDQGKIQIIGYKPRYSGTTTIKAEFEGDNYYEARSRTRQAIVSKIPTLILQNFPRTESDGNDIMVTLYENADENPDNSSIPINNDTIPYAKLIFYVNQDNGPIDETKPPFAVEETDANGFCRINGAKLNKVGTSRIRVKYEGSDIYAESSTEYEFEVKSLIDKCNDLASWEPIVENWYASDGSAKFGKDVNGLNGAEVNAYWWKTYYQNVVDKPYKHNPRRIYQGSNYIQRDFCNDLKTEGFKESDGIHAPTGVILRNKYIKTFENCTIQFKIKFLKRDNKDIDSKVTDEPMYGGHFGLIKPTDTTAENAIVRFETYRNNQYTSILNFGKDEGVSAGKFKKDLTCNTEYNINIKTTSTRVEITIDEFPTKKEVYTAKSGQNINFIGLAPYIYSFVNSTDVVISEMKISKN